MGLKKIFKKVKKAVVSPKGLAALAVGAAGFTIGGPVGAAILSGMLDGVIMGAAMGAASSLVSGKNLFEGTVKGGLLGGITGGVAGGAYAKYYNLNEAQVGSKLFSGKQLTTKGWQDVPKGVGADGAGAGLIQKETLNAPFQQETLTTPSELGGAKPPSPSFFTQGPRPEITMPGATTGGAAPGEQGWGDFGREMGKANVQAAKWTGGLMTVSGAASAYATKEANDSGEKARLKEQKALREGNVAGDSGLEQLLGDTKFKAPQSWVFYNQPRGLLAGGVV